MFYLILAILSSTFVSVFMRLGDKDIKNDMVMFTSNYLVCSLLSLYFFPSDILAIPGEGLGFAVLLGVLSGVLYLLSFVLLHLNIKKNGVVLSSMFMKLGVLVPTLMAIVIYGEKAKVNQVAGFLLAICAIIIINGNFASSKAAATEESSTNKYSTEESSTAAPAACLKKSFLSSGKIWLLILLVMSGFTDSLANVYDKQGVSALKDHYLFFTFFVAMLFSIAMGLKQKQHITLKDLFWGALIGIPNYFSARFLLLSLASLNAIVVYPVYNVATILAISSFGVLLFREKLEKNKAIGLLLILAALVLLNI